MTNYARGPSISGDSYRDRDGIETWDKYRDEQLVRPLNFSELLDPGETISTATWNPSGVTIVASVLADPLVTVTVKGCGTAELTLVTSTQTRKLTYRWRALDKSIGDYRD